MEAQSMNPINIVLKIFSKVLREALMQRIIISAFFLCGFVLFSGIAHATSHDFF